MKPAARCTLHRVLPQNMMKLAKGFRLRFYKILQSNHHELKYFHHNVMSLLSSTTLSMTFHCCDPYWLNCIAFLCIVPSLLQALVSFFLDSGYEKSLKNIVRRVANKEKGRKPRERKPPVCPLPAISLNIQINNPHVFLLSSCSDHSRTLVQEKEIPAENTSMMCSKQRRSVDFAESWELFVFISTDR